jgi:hypothetical protein
MKPEKRGWAWSAGISLGRLPWAALEKQHADEVQYRKLVKANAPVASSPICFTAIQARQRNQPSLRPARDLHDLALRIHNAHARLFQ